jgi:hypothetical protein
LLFEISHNKWDEVESDDEDDLVEMCPTTSITTTDHQASTLKEEGGKRSEGESLWGRRLNRPQGRSNHPQQRCLNLLW